jgi:hypothetical protein
MQIAGLVLRAVSISLVVSNAFGGVAMPVARQNELVHQYCAVCHTDAARNGGLTLEHFDAAHMAPSLAAMLVSKLTAGVELKIVNAVETDASAAARVDRGMKGGAMGAAGISIPDKATVDALIGALASQARGATEWSVNRTGDVVTASILREAPVESVGQAAAYRLLVACNSVTGQGQMQLAWSPSPKSGTLVAAVDGKATFTYQVEGKESMGNGSKVMAGPAAMDLYPGAKIPLPTRVLTVSDLAPNQRVVFPFGELDLKARQDLAGCFTGSVDR